MKTRHIASLLALLVLTPSVAQAQDTTYRIAVLPGLIEDVSDQEWEDIVEESAYLVEDFGGFDVYRYYMLDTVLDDDTVDDVLDCEDDPYCYMDELESEGNFDYVLVTNIYEDGDEIVVHYIMIDVLLAEIAEEQIAYMPTPTDFPYLMVPNHECLKVTPEWQDQGPIETEVEVDGEIEVDEDDEDEVLVELPPTDENLDDDDDDRRDRNRNRDRDRDRDREPMEFGMGHYVLAGGATAIVGGVFLGFAADATQQEIQARPHPRAELEDLQSQGRTRQTFANILYGLGGAAVVTGVVLMVLDDGGESDDDSDPWVQLEIDPVRRWVGISGEF